MITREDAIILLKCKLEKSKNLFDGYKNGNMPLEQLCGNLAERVLNYVETRFKMTPEEPWIKEEDLQIYIDPPSGWKYGFPKILPVGIADLKQWFIDEGYPADQVDLAIKYSRMWEDVPPKGKTK